MLRSSRKPKSTSSTSPSPPSFQESLDYLDDIMYSDSDSDDYPASPVEDSSPTSTNPYGSASSHSDSKKHNSNSTMSDDPSSVMVFPSPSRETDASDDSSPPTPASSWTPSVSSSKNSSSKSSSHGTTGTTSASTNTSEESRHKSFDIPLASGVDKSVVDKKPTNNSAYQWSASSSPTGSEASTFTPAKIGNSTMAVNITSVPLNSVAFNSAPQSKKPTSPQSDIPSLNLVRLTNSTADSGSKGSENPSSQTVEQGLSRTTIVAIALPIFILLLVAMSAILYVHSRNKRSSRSHSDNASEWSFQVVEPEQFATQDIKSELQRSGTTSTYESSSFSQTHHQTKDKDVLHTDLPYLDPTAVERLQPDHSLDVHASRPTSTIHISAVKSPVPKSPGRTPDRTSGDGPFLQIAQKFMNARHSSQWIFRSHLPSRLSVKPPVTDALVPPPHPVALPGLRSYGQNPSK
ncbi:uncharacterized protein MELLADRAFT_78555 [Melampsora larici-populina 98AG31]|uniref:Uncharacterized protein n=1 Tax=Melampsora larici-populina (strain 98AG31 / pathotype 3-4-7) TaxID=747676 RepID=F4RVU5_MELLP|nr:uncharacterized protein MELLADRAFT_78555 [Melampsora larici-populina 98AG31]EGG03521.1 hypothetical protein MELLADRAFT_78555 [Melampsora larici-populina 98AG31]